MNQTARLIDEFVEFLRPRTIGATISGRRVPFHVRVWTPYRGTDRRIARRIARRHRQRFRIVQARPRIYEMMAGYWLGRR